MTPYIPANSREEASLRPSSPGELNYALTRLVNYWLETGGASPGGGVNYRTISEVVGALECAKLEVYRRIAAPYENIKKASNGDVYSNIPPSQEY